MQEMPANLLLRRSEKQPDEGLACPFEDKGKGHSFSYCLSYRAALDWNPTEMTYFVLFTTAGDVTQGTHAL